jgi:hypothetical protein
MDPKFQTSFIPKKPIVTGGVKSADPVNLFSLLGTIVFIVALALSGGVFFYQKLITKQIDTDKASLERAKDAFDPDTINEIIRVDTRLETGKVLLDSHVAVTPFFDFLSTITLQSVRFRDFSFTYLGKDNIQVGMKGVAQGYAAVALQSDLLNEQKLLRETIISDMSLEASGNVSFTVSTKIDPSLLSYKEALTRGGAPVSTPQP